MGNLSIFTKNYNELKKIVYVIKLKCNSRKSCFWFLLFNKFVARCVDSIFALMTNNNKKVSRIKKYSYLFLWTSHLITDR